MQKHKKKNLKNWSLMTLPLLFAVLYDEWDEIRYFCTQSISRKAKWNKRVNKMHCCSDDIAAEWKVDQTSLSVCRERVKAGKKGTRTQWMLWYAILELGRKNVIGLWTVGYSWRPRALSLFIFYIIHSQWMTVEVYRFSSCRWNRHCCILDK